MASVEHFFLGCGITVFSLGLIACLVPGSFKRGVIAMLTGDACFLLAILYPRYFSQFSVFAQNWFNYSLLGVAVGGGDCCREHLVDFGKNAVKKICRTILSYKQQLPNFPMNMLRQRYLLLLKKKKNQQKKIVSAARFFQEWRGKIIYADSISVNGGCLCFKLRIS